MRVYGEESNALNIIRDHLDRDGTTAIHSDLRRLFSVDMDQQNIVGSSPGQEAVKEFPPLPLSGLPWHL